MKGFVSIILDRTSSLKPNTIIDKINRLPNVQLAHLVTGNVDAMAFIDAPSLDAFRDALFAISKVKGVASTITNVAL
jgi:DNA-binding Lrp family transcriptional regulator